MTSGGAGQESGFGPQGVGLRPARSPRPVWRWLVVLAVVVSAGVVFAVWDATGHAARRPDRYPQGACVVVKAQEPGGELHAQAVRCDVDPSFTVAKVAGRSDNCGADKYTRIRPPFSDVATGRLCLVPNLVVGHCYRFGVPMGMWDLVGCAGAGPATIKVTKRVDTEDPHACPAQTKSLTPGIRTVLMPKQLRYPSRTYCYSDPGD
jgi:hypothetical protein